MTQLISEPTRIEDRVNNLRDLCIVSDEKPVISSGVLPSFSQLDHFPIFVSVQARILESKTIRKKNVWDYSRLDAPRLTNELMTINWDDILRNDIDVATEQFSSAILSAANNAIPRKVISIRSWDKPWMNSDIKRLIRKRDRLFKTARSKEKKSKNSNDIKAAWDRWKHCRNEVTNLLRHSKSQYMRREALNLIQQKQTPYKYHSTFRRMTGQNKMIDSPPLQKDDDSLVVDDLEKAELLNAYLSTSHFCQTATAKKLHLLQTTQYLSWTFR